MSCYSMDTIQAAHNYTHVHTQKEDQENKFPESSASSFFAGKAECRMQREFGPV